MLSAVGRTLRRSLGVAPQLQQGLRAFGAPTGHDDEHDHEPSYESTPTVFDNMIKLNVVDLNGKRHTVHGLVGKTLSQTLIDAGFPKVSIGSARGDSVQPQKPGQESALVVHRTKCLTPDLCLVLQTYFFPNLGFYTQHIVSGATEPCFSRARQQQEPEKAERVRACVCPAERRARLYPTGLLVRRMSFAEHRHN